MSGKAVVLPEPKGAVDVLFVAGEHSGDQHAAKIAGQLFQQHPEIGISAIGGPALEQAGAQLLHDLTQSSVVGLVEVLKHYGDFKRLFEALLDWVKEYQPKVVVLVDYPGFNLRLAEALKKKGISRKGGGKVAVYQYVSPQIWAWKASRRFKMAEVLDELGVIFPFEIDCYKDTSLPVHFVGHPFVREGYRNSVSYDSEGDILLLPGSRKQPVKRIFPVLLEAFRLYRDSGGTRGCTCLYPEEGIRDVLQETLDSHQLDPSWISLKPVESGAQSCAVLTSSGTMSLNCALAGIPGAIVYRAHPITVWMGQRMVKIDWLGIANLVLDRELYPEFIQGAADPKVLAGRLASWIDDPALRESYAEGAIQLQDRLSSGDATSVAQRLEQYI
ncbi:MAG: lipid-A-disaccharide synthase [Puniceicoccaceae bacterium]